MIVFYIHYKYISDKDINNITNPETGIIIVGIVLLLLVITFIKRYVKIKTNKQG